MGQCRAAIKGALAAVVLMGCSYGGVESTEAEPIGASEEALTGPALLGKVLFDHALPDTNGRSCATCHVQAEHTALRIANVEARFQAHPCDPLFHPLDADDPGAAQLTFDHLRKRGLIRITLPLAPNLDLIDDAGNVITNAARTISVWRGVPSIENTALTAPYLTDGRATSLEQQAASALHDHSQIAHPPLNATLGKIAAFEKEVFSSAGMKSVFDAIKAGQTPPDPDPPFPAGSDEAAGKALFQVACEGCHGGHRGTQITDRAAHDQLFIALNPDGTLQTTTLPDGTSVPVPLGGHDDDEFLNIGISFGAYLRQVPPELGGLPNTSGLTFPHYRLRFYTSSSRTQKLVDLPPPLFDPVTGQPMLGPNNFPQAFTVDPGRSIITGDPADYEAFDVPSLHGIANTAPYYHDNSRLDLQSVLDLYSRAILPFIPSIGLPGVVPPAGPGLPPESLTALQKAQIIAYLKKI